ncbi:MAG: threonine/serine exporter family protein [Ruminobacter sp.]|jgi:uncharacterized membrane protein YjjP (DUF1212 family)|uniref:Uncharacterized membrane protein YjjP, DUF1212 family n=1 Tax=Ruminobacter amylophilus TaxID=867 RepID=A0A662ZIW8_9GAMM|nr:MULTISPECIES: threonine/serine exporter family protein [Ruminobacter]MBQ3776263.1 threonine/serine exporter family protein [Ruminobacter sp.]SFP17556.1 Uncharacterized membrane protein YjjP, DUF1212 family [Ruminobacter amylophilus]
MKNSDFAELIVSLARRMYMCGSETRLIIQTTERVASAYGCQATVIVSPGSVGVKLVFPVSDEREYREEYTTFGRIDRVGINMHNLVFYTRLCQDAEKGLITADELMEKLEHIPQFSYNRLFMVAAVGIATAAFSVINGGDMDASMTALVAGTITMACKLLMQKFHLFDMFIFTTCGFISTIISFWVGTGIFHLSEYNLAVAMVVSLLLLVPGFPFITGILDLFKGYTSVGATRLINSIMLVASVCLGIMTAFSILPIDKW